MKHELIYLLHFETALHHAQHYLGSTTNVCDRLESHAAGNGAKLTEVLFERNEHWRLAALWQLTDNSSRLALERRIKNHHNGTRYCPICNPDARNPIGTIDVPFYPITSHELRSGLTWQNHEQQPKPKPQ